MIRLTRLLDQGSKEVRPGPRESHDRKHERNKIRPTCLSSVPCWSVFHKHYFEDGGSQAGNP